MSIMFPNVGIMQGRLTPSRGRGVQFFPKEEGEWIQEFSRAAALGLSHLEWVWDREDNPLVDAGFRERVRQEIMKTGVRVRGADLQFLTKTDFANVSEALFADICQAMADIGGEAIEPPLLEASSLLHSQAREVYVARLAKLVETAKRCALSLHLETDLPPRDYAKLLREIPSLQVVYDSGNSACMGYDVDEEWNMYGAAVANVQIKDRPQGGSTVPLGQGATDFRTLFMKMKEARYTGPVTLQAAREEDDHEEETVRTYLAFLQTIYESL